MIRYFEVASSKCLHVCRAHTAPVMSSCVTQDSSILCTGGEDQTVIMWNTSSGEKIRQLRGHTGTVRCLTLTKDDNYLVNTFPFE